MFRTALPVLFSALVLAGCNSEPEDTRPGQPVAHRRAAFKEIIKVFEPMGLMMRTDSYDADKLKTLTAQLMARRGGPWAYFTADTLDPSSHASAEVCSEPDRSAADKKAFFDATDALAAVVEQPDETTARAAHEAVEEACQSCHKACSSGADGPPSPRLRYCGFGRDAEFRGDAFIRPSDSTRGCR